MGAKNGCGKVRGRVVIPSPLLPLCLCPTAPALLFPTGSLGLPGSLQKFTGSHWCGSPRDGMGDAAPRPNAGVLGHQGRIRPLGGGVCLSLAPQAVQLRLKH